MFVVKNGGKQYLAKSGAVLSLDKISGEIGDNIDLEVIMDCTNNEINTAKKTVKAVIVKHYRDDKIIVFKKIRRHHYERKKGHKQPLSLVKIS